MLKAEDSLDVSGDFSAKTATAANYGSVHDFGAVQQPGSSSGGSANSKHILDNLFSADRAQLGVSSSFPPASNGEAKSWYLKCTNRYISFAAALVHIIVVVFINKWFALCHLVAFVVLYLYFGGTCSAASDQGFISGM